MRDQVVKVLLVLLLTAGLVSLLGGLLGSIVILAVQALSASPSIAATTTSSGPQPGRGQENTADTVVWTQPASRGPTIRGGHCFLGSPGACRILGVLASG